MKLPYIHKMTVAAHRGDCYNAKENTMTAFKLAIENGCDMIETDVRLTKDNKLILMHDDKPYRTTGAPGMVKDYTFDEIRKLNAGTFCNCDTVPTFEELMELIAPLGIMLNLEIKEYNRDGNKERCDLCIEKCIEVIEKYNYADKMVFNSFDAYVLQYIDENYHGKYMLHGFYPYTIMFNVDKNPDDFLYCACIFEDKPEYYQYLIDRNIEPWIGAGVTIRDNMRFAAEHGAKLITTNNPADAIKKLKELGARK